MGKYQAYPEYKVSEIDWLETIPEHWKTSKLRYTFSFGKGLSITKENLRDTGTPCISYGEVHSKYGFEIDPALHSLKCVDDEYLKTSRYALLEKGDIVFADTSEDIDGSGNFTQLVSDEQVFAGYHTIIARPYRRESSRYFAYLLDSKELRTQIRHAVKGVKVFSVTQAILRGVIIWLPPTEERNKIANFLDHETAKIDTLIEKQQQLIKLLKEKRQAVISHAVTKGLNPEASMKYSGVEWLGKVPEHWEIPKLINITSKIGDGLHSTPTYQDGTGYYFVNGNNLAEKNIRIGGTAKEVPYSVYLKHKLPLDQQTVFLSINGTIGNVARYNNEQIILGKSAAYINCRAIDASYLIWFLTSNQARNYYDLEVTGTTINNLSLDSIRRMRVPLPPPQEQLKINIYCISHSQKYEDLIEAASKQRSLLIERRTALISAAVTGKIDVRNWKPTDNKNTEEVEVTA